MKIRIVLLITLGVALMLSSCKKGKLKSSNSDFSDLYNQLISDGYETDNTWDAEVHSYNFVLSSNKTLNSIGYQSHEDLSSTPYIIEIFNLDDSVVVYSGDHIFDVNDISYETPNTTVSLQAGVNYQVSRIQTNWGQYVTETIGHLVKTDDSVYPVSSGVLTITESNFHDFGEQDLSWAKNQALPRIDLVFD
ncbi:hypothetical protein [Parvicella tangerina]|uniref:Uncharacterized protein n=1 Tax=Parvicella tangerina TaxID=2829795 RepID=A0A916JLR4_9FLAO|nr:hypothetical protein [Parvicella tangerina]CAG5081445.1 hypothetical protein CRYO30217_01634 [Parvicella tangerina]